MNLKFLKISLMSIAGLFDLILVFGSYSIVQPGTMGIKVTMGKANPGALSPGFHFKAPLVSYIVPMSVRVNNYTIRESAQSLDLQDIVTSVAVNFHVEPQDVSWVYTHVGSEYQMSQQVLAPMVSNVFKAVIAKYNAEELTQKRNLVRKEIQERLQKSMLTYRTLVDQVNITNFAFTPQFHAAIERKQIALQKAQQATYELQRAKVKAQEKIVSAEAEQKAIELVQSSLTTNYVKYQAVQKWNGVLPTVTTGGGIPLIDLGNVAKK